MEYKQALAINSAGILMVIATSESGLHNSQIASLYFPKLAKLDVPFNKFFGPLLLIIKVLDS